MGASSFLVFLIQAQDNLCACCGTLMDRESEDDGDWPSTDHVVPRKAGGGDHDLNKVAMHRRCNSGKNHRLPTGCELIFHHIVLAKLEVEKEIQQKFITVKSGATLSDIWPKEKVRAV